MKTSVKKLVENAKKKINNLEVSDAMKMHSEKTNLFIDVRDIREIWKEGTIKDSLHIPRGMLEFWLDPNSAYYQEKKIKNAKKMVFFCALGFRSALATKALLDMGFKNVANASGGFDALKNEGLEVIQKEKK